MVSNIEASTPNTFLGGGCP